MCTAVRFTDANGALFFGRNLDWTESYGEQVLVTPRGFDYRYAFNADHREESLAVMGIGSVMDGKPMYFDCANEAGLAVAGLNFPRCGVFPHTPAPGKTNIATFEFPLWVARNFATADKVCEALGNAALVSPAIPGQPESLLHWIISDARRCIVVECTKSGLRIHENRIGVLANSPEFPWHEANLDNYICATSEPVKPAAWGSQPLVAWGIGAGMEAIPGGVGSAARFVRAAYTNANPPATDTERKGIARLFRTLSAVQMVDGMAKAPDGRFEKTLFTSGFSAASATYYANTYDDFEIRAFPFSEFQLDGADLQTRPLYR